MVKPVFKDVTHIHTQRKEQTAVFKSSGWLKIQHWRKHNLKYGSKYI